MVGVTGQIITLLVRNLVQAKKYTAAPALAALGSRADECHLPRSMYYVFHGNPRSSPTTSQLLASP